MRMFVFRLTYTLNRMKQMGFFTLCIFALSMGWSQSGLPEAENSSSKVYEVHYRSCWPEPRWSVGANAGSGLGWMGLNNSLERAFLPTSPGWALNAGLSVRMALAHGKFALRTGLEYEIKGYDIRNFEASTDEHPVLLLEKANMRYEYLTLPLLAEVSVPFTRGKLRLLGGGYVSLPFRSYAPSAMSGLFKSYTYITSLIRYDTQKLDAGWMGGLVYRLPQVGRGQWEIQAMYRHGLLWRGSIVAPGWDHHRVATAGLGWFFSVK